MSNNYSDSAQELTASRTLTEETLVQWIQWFKEKEGRCPGQDDPIVWIKNEDGGWTEAPNEKWHNLNMALRRKSRGLKIEGVSSLLDLIEKHHLNDLSVTQLIDWIRLFHEKEKGKRWPTQRDKTVWDKDEKGEWKVVPHESWNAIDASLRNQRRGLVGVAQSLSIFRDICGLNDDLTEHMLLQWVKWFKEKIGRYPNTTDKEDGSVWIKGMDGKWITVPGENWNAIDQALINEARRVRKIKGAYSLLSFLQKHGLAKPPPSLKEEKIVQWIKWFREKEGRYPALRDETVWAKDEKDRWFIVPDENWGAIDQAIGDGARGLKIKGAKTLLELRKKHGLVDDSPVRTSRKPRSGKDTAEDPEL